MASTSITDYWRLADTPIDGHDGPEYTIRPGTSYDCHVVTTRHSDPPADNPTAWESALDRFESLLAYGARAGQFELHELEQGRVAFTETHDGGVPNGSLVVSLRPPADTTFSRGGWFLVDSVEDLSTLTNYPNLTLSLVYLAPLADYPTRSTLTFDLRAPQL